MRKYNLIGAMSDRIAWDEMCEASITASINAVEDDEEVMAYILANPMEYIGDLWGQERIGITDDEDDGNGMVYIDDLEEAKARFQEVGMEVINNVEIANSVTVWEYCRECDYEREFPIPAQGMIVLYIEECPECGAFLEREFEPNKLVVDTIQLSSATPSQSDSPGGMAYTTGEEANVYWSYEHQSYGFYIHGISNCGNAFEGDDNDGFSSVEEVKDYIHDA